MPATSGSSFTMTGDTPAIFNPAGQTGYPIIGDPVQGARLTTIQAVALATNDTSIALPLGARILAVTALPSVAATGATSGFSVGTTVGGTDIVANTSVLGTVQIILPIALTGSKPLLVANYASIVATSNGGSIIWVRNTQTTQTAVGTFLLFIEYVMA